MKISKIISKAKQNTPAAPRYDHIGNHHVYLIIIP